METPVLESFFRDNLRTAARWAIEYAEQEDVGEGLEDILPPARALLASMLTKAIPAEVSNLRLSLFLSSLLSLVMWKAYQTGKRHAMAELVLCGNVEEHKEL